MQLVMLEVAADAAWRTTSRPGSRKASICGARSMQSWPEAILILFSSSTLPFTWQRAAIHIYLKRQTRDRTLALHGIWSNSAPSLVDSQRLRCRTKTESATMCTVIAHNLTKCKIVQSRSKENTHGGCYKHKSSAISHVTRPRFQAWQSALSSHQPPLPPPCPCFPMWR